MFLPPNGTAWCTENFVVLLRNFLGFRQKSTAAQIFPPYSLFQAWL